MVRYCKVIRGLQLSDIPYIAINERIIGMWYKTFGRTITSLILWKQQPQGQRSQKLTFPDVISWQARPEYNNGLDCGQMVAMFIYSIFGILETFIF